MKKSAAVFVLVLFGFIISGSRTHSINNNQQLKEAKFSCPYLKSQKAENSKKAACPFQEKQKQIYYEINKKRAAEKIKLS